MIFTADQLVAHLVGDYIFQSHWMATEKVKQTPAAATHAFFYTLPFALITQSPWALLVIALTHFVIDRYRLARYVVWLKNGAQGPVTATGYPEDVPPWLAVWLLIIADNVMHIVINGAAIRWLS